MSSTSEVFRPTAEIFPWEPAAWLRVTGADALPFLQGQFTNDLRGLGGPGAVYGLWLNHKGKVLADSFVVGGSGEGEFWVGSYFSAAEIIRERLEAFIIADDVVVEDATAGWAAVTVLGAGEPVVEVGAARSFVGRRGTEAVVEWVFPRERREEVMLRLSGASVLSAEDMERRRILAGIPAVPRDIGSGELPNEGGLEAAAISYTKGCYLGQEVMARLKSMGQVRRRLMRVRGRGAAPETPAGLFQGERNAGELRTAVREGEGFVGLALVSLLNAREAAGLSLRLGAEPTVEWFPGEFQG